MTAGASAHSPTVDWTAAVYGAADSRSADADAGPDPNPWSAGADTGPDPNPWSAGAGSDHGGGPDDAARRNARTCAINSGAGGSRPGCGGNDGWDYQQECSINHRVFPRGWGEAMDSALNRDLAATKPGLSLTCLFPSYPRIICPLMPAQRFAAMPLHPESADPLSGRPRPRRRPRLLPRRLALRATAW